MALLSSILALSVLFAFCSAARLPMKRRFGCFGSAVSSAAMTSWAEERLVASLSASMAATVGVVKHETRTQSKDLGGALRGGVPGQATRH